MRDAFDSFKGKGQFSGHETFPLRLLWLKKAFDVVGTGVPATFFTDPEAIVRFGVGRNMAVSIRYWSVATGMIKEESRILKATPLGAALLADGGWDPYLEHAATIWLAHWNLASTPDRSTTIYYAFNAIVTPEFDAGGLVEELTEEAKRLGWVLAETTLKRDVEVLLRSYVRRREANVEDAAEALLCELGLLKEIRPSMFAFSRGPKATLPDAVFAYALDAFWERTTSGTSLSAEQITYGVGSPGRVFKLDEDSVAERLMRMREFTGGAWSWTDNAGLRQVQKSRKVDPLKLLEKTYQQLRRGAAA